MQRPEPPAEIGTIGTRKHFAKDVLTLLTGTVAAQALMMAALPVLTRAYSAEQFGYFGAYSAAVGILAIFINARIDLAVVAARADAVAATLAAVSILCALSLGIALTTLTALIVWGWALYFHLDPLYWIATIPAAASAVAIFNTYCAWHNRKSRFRMIAGRRFVQSLLMVTLQSAFVWLIPLGTGLMFGSCLAYVATAIFWSVHTWKKDRAEFILVSMNEFWIEFRSIRSFSSKAITVDVISQALYQLPLLFFGYMYSAQTMGYYTLTQRILGTPANLVGGAVAEVFRQRATQAYAVRGNCRAVFSDTLRLLTLIVCLSAPVLLWVLPDIFAALFGQAWREAGRYSQILLPVFALKFVSHPLSYVILLRGKLAIEIRLHVLMLVTLMVSMSACALFSVPVTGMLVCYATIYAVGYLTYIYLSFRLSLGEIVDAV